jgi:hypothetical protein
LIDCLTSKEHYDSYVYNKNTLSTLPHVDENLTITKEKRGRDKLEKFNLHRDTIDNCQHNISRCRLLKLLLRVNGRGVAFPVFILHAHSRYITK